MIELSRQNGRLQLAAFKSASRSMTKAAVLLSVAAGVVSVWFLAMLTGGLFATPYKTAIRGWDNSFYYYWIRSPAVGGDFDFRDDVRDTGTLDWPGAKESALARPATATGLLPNPYGIGWALSAIPFYAIADGVVVIARKFGASVPRDGYSAPYQLSLLLGQFAYAIIGLFLAFKVLCKWFKPEIAAVAILLTWLSGFLFFYQVYELTMAHSITFVAVVAACFWAHTLERRSRSSAAWMCLGLSAGLVIVSRYQAVVHLLYPMVVAGRIALRDGATLRRAFLAVFVFGGVVSLQMAAWKIVYGSWLVYSYGQETFNWRQPQLANVLFSPFHGLFYWSPIYVLSFVGLCLFILERSRETWAFLVSVAAAWVINASWWNWWFGAAFGGRAFEGCVLMFMIGTATLLTRTAGTMWRPTLLGAFGLAAVFNVALANAAASQDLPLERPLTYRQMIVVLHSGRHSLVPQRVRWLEKRLLRRT